MRLTISIYNVGGGRLISEVTIRREYIALADMMDMVNEELEALDIINYHLEITYDTREN